MQTPSPLAVDLFPVRTMRSYEPVPIEPNRPLPAHTCALTHSEAPLQSMALYEALHGAGPLNVRSSLPFHLHLHHRDISTAATSCCCMRDISLDVPISNSSSHHFKRHFGQRRSVGVCTGTTMRAASTYRNTPPPLPPPLSMGARCCGCTVSSPGSAHQETRPCMLVRSARWVRCKTQSDRNLARRAHGWFHKTR